MVPLEQTFLETISKNLLIRKGQTILLAVSGGPDSTALLYLLASLLPEHINAVAYIDHHLRPEETAREEAHVRQLCHSFKIRFIYAEVNVPDEKEITGESAEECARRLRYHTLESIRCTSGADLIATGHTSDDQAEELLIRLIRGTGLQGLSGMKLKRNRIIRPLLHCSKDDILRYLEEHDTPFCLDSSNRSTEFLRNRVRLELLPMLEASFNPSIRQTLQNTAAILREDDHYLEKKCALLYDTIVKKTVPSQKEVTKELCYAVNSFISQHIAMQRRIIEKICWQMGSKPSFKAIESIREMTRNGSTGTEIHLQKGLTVLKTARNVSFLLCPLKTRKRLYRDASFTESVMIDSPGRYEVPSLGRVFYITETSQPETLDSHHLYLDASTVTFPLILRQPEQGECFTPLGAPGRKKITRYFSDKKIPRHSRYLYPVVISEDKIIAIAGLVISDHVKTRSTTTTYLILSWEQTPD